MIKGSIISPDWILTAAHCTPKSNKATDIVTRVGSDLLASGGNLHAISEIHAHPKWNKTITWDYDVALMKVCTPIVLVPSKTVAAALSNSDDEYLPGNLVFVSGWGKTSAKANGFSPKLLGVLIEIKNQQNCEMNYNGVATITPRMVCAADTDADSCEVS